MFGRTKKSFLFSNKHIKSTCSKKTADKKIINHVPKLISKTVSIKSQLKLTTKEKNLLKDYNKSQYYIWSTVCQNTLDFMKIYIKVRFI